MSTALVAAAPACSWAHPGANPYRGDPVHALADFDLPAQTRRKLRELMAAHRYTDVATITRDDIVGKNGYTDLREMHSGRGTVCHGSVDRSAWSPTRRERGLVYCADDACVIVPTICNNVSLVTRRADAPVALDDGPIDIEPAAGPKPDAAAPAAAPGTSDALDFMPAAGGDAAAGTTPPLDGGAGGGTGGGAAGSGNGFPSGGGPFGGGDGGVVVAPGTPITSPVPEVPAWAMLLAGLGLAGAAARRRAR